MIRRAQAEALLELAEALEECERNDVRFWAEGSGLFIVPGNEFVGEMRSVDVRMAIAKLYPKSEAAE
jgi:hypothetical protein